MFKSYFVLCYNYLEIFRYENQLFLSLKQKNQGQSQLWTDQRQQKSLRLIIPKMRKTASDCYQQLDYGGCKTVIRLTQLDYLLEQDWITRGNNVTCQPIVGLRNRALLGSRPLNASRTNTRYATTGEAVSSPYRAVLSWTAPCVVTQQAAMTSHGITLVSEATPL
jgi:hypothetical protein